MEGDSVRADDRHLALLSYQFVLFAKLLVVAAVQETVARSKVACTHNGQLKGCLRFLDTLAEGKFFGLSYRIDLILSFDSESLPAALIVIQCLKVLQPDNNPDVLQLGMDFLAKFISEY